MPEKPPAETLTVDELLRRANVQPVAAPAPVAKPEPIVNGAFVDKGGRMMYRYEVNGEAVILPKPVEQMSEQDFYNLPISLYDNMPGRIPQNLSVKFKDPQWAGYWFNKSAKFGQRVSVARSLGYVPAKKEDLLEYSLELNDQDGAVEQHDLVLMKIHKAKLYMQYKQWSDKAKIMGGIEGYKNAANQSLNPSNREKDPYFFTPQATQEFQGVGPVSNLPTVGTR